MQESTQLFYQAATLMLVGMGFVFGFLGLLIGVIKTLISPLASRFPDQTPLSGLSPTPNSIDNETSTPIIAAISAAISQYRKKHQ